MIFAQKQQLRSEMLQRAKQESDATDADHAAFLENLSKLPQWNQASSVLLYAPLASEVNLLKLLEKVGTRRFLFPRIHNQELHLHQWIPTSSWIIGPYSIQEPDHQEWPLVPLEEVDLALIPGLAFDREGGRLGRGKGFYDRLLGAPQWHGFKVGVAWPWQLVSKVPRERHDVLMDTIITSEAIPPSRMAVEK